MRTILIVDDEFGVANVLAAALADEGYRVFVAANGRQGLDRLSENKPDLVVLDFMMPLLDGAGMARAMRADPAFADIPIIMMSALAEPAIRERFDGYAVFFASRFASRLWWTRSRRFWRRMGATNSKQSGPRGDGARRRPCGGPGEKRPRRNTEGKLQRGADNWLTPTYGGSARRFSAGISLLNWRCVRRDRRLFPELRNHRNPSARVQRLRRGCRLFN